MAQVLKNSQIIFHTFQCSSFQGCFPPNTPWWPKSQALRWYNRNRGTSTDHFFNRVTLSTSVSEPCQSLWWSITESVPQASKTPRSSFTLLHPEFLTLFLTLFWHSFLHFFWHCFLHFFDTDFYTGLRQHHTFQSSQIPNHFPIRAASSKPSFLCQHLLNAHPNSHIGAILPKGSHPGPFFLFFYKVYKRPLPPPPLVL